MTRSKKERGLGFRELESFNNALLGKMAAMIISEPNTLWIRVLKGLYFPTSSKDSGGEMDRLGPQVLEGGLSESCSVI